MFLSSDIILSKSGNIYTKYSYKLRTYVGMKIAIKLEYLDSPLHLKFKEAQKKVQIDKGLHIHERGGPIKKGVFFTCLESWS
jgi:hypothetical protein